MLELDNILDETDCVSVDIESNGPDIALEGWELWGISFSGESDSIYLDVGEGNNFNICKEAIETISRQRRPMVFHNGKYDLRGLRRAGMFKNYDIFWGLVIDTMLAQNYLDENINPKQIGLKPLTKKYFKVDLPDYLESSSHGRHSSQFKKYAENDTYYTRKLWVEKFRQQMIDEDLIKLFTKISMKTLIMLCETEDAGIRWDLKRSEELIWLYADLRSTAERKLREVIGDDINLNSGQQLAKRIFDDLGYSDKGIRINEKSGDRSMDAATVETLALKEPLFKELLTYRNASKMIGTYIEPQVKQSIRSYDKRIHPTFWQTSVTGRKRCEKPNFQNQPVIYDPTLNIRSCVIPRPGYKLVVADLSQIELRLCAHISGDKEMIKAYVTWQCRKCDSTGINRVYLTRCPNCGEGENEKVIKDPTFKGFFHGLDIHQITADALSIPRNPSVGNDAAAKNVNFAAIYMATAWKMQQQFGTYTVDQWEVIIHKFFKKYKGVRQWHNYIEQFLNDDGVVKSIFGRKRRIPKASIRMSYKHALNMAVNFPVQSSAGTYLEIAERKMREDCLEADIYEKIVFPINEVHDEVMYEAREDIAEDVLDLLITNMRYAVPLNVPIGAEGKVVDHWGLMK